MSNESITHFIGVRHLQTLLIFLQVTLAFMIRNNVGVAVVAMTNASSGNAKYPIYNWNGSIKSYIISSFTWGYMITPFLGGYLSHHMGPKNLMLIANILAALFVLLLPFAVGWGGWKAFCGCRTLQGIFFGLAFPACNQHLANWLTSEEKNLLGGFAYSGIELGSMLAMVSGEAVTKSSWGWPGISYISGGLIVFWCILWWLFSANLPQQFRWISAAELSYITARRRHNSFVSGKHLKIPWKALLSSAAIWALSMVRSAKLWTVNTLDSYLPTYMLKVLQIDTSHNVLYMALPYLVSWCAMLLGIFLMALSIRRKWLSINTLRKLILTLAFCIAALSFVAIGLLNQSDVKSIVSLLTINMVMVQVASTQILVNGLDLSPNHAGIVMGIYNTVANILVAVAPITVGLIVLDESNFKQWQIIFDICALFLVLSNVVFLIWGSTKIQAWNDENFLQSKPSASLYRQHSLYQ